MFCFKYCLKHLHVFCLIFVSTQCGNHLIYFTIVNHNLESRTNFQKGSYKEEVSEMRSLFLLSLSECSRSFYSPYYPPFFCNESRLSLLKYTIRVVQDSVLRGKWNECLMHMPAYWLA